MCLYPPIPPSLHSQGRGVAICSMCLSRGRGRGEGEEEGIKKLCHPSCACLMRWDQLQQRQLSKRNGWAISVAVEFKSFG